jgi:ectonucleoside triphosphate diphosphohydrolase 5/6
LEAVRQEIKSYGFLFEDDWVAMITGTQEATYDWLSIQEIIYIESYYNASYIFYQFPSISKTTTIGVIDLGGGSVEMTFYPPDDALGTTVNEGEFVALNFNTKYYDIYGHSYLGYGHNSARTLLQGTLSNNQGISLHFTSYLTTSTQR